MIASTLEIVDVREAPDLASTIETWLYVEWGWRVQSPTDHRLWFRETLIDHDRRFPVCFGARLDGEPAGSASLIEDDLLTEPYDQASGATPWLAAVYTAPRFRGRGVASRLIQAVMDRAREAGEPAIWVQTPDAQTLYARFGFEPVGETWSAEADGRVTVMRAPLGGRG